MVVVWSSFILSIPMYSSTLKLGWLSVACPIVVVVVAILFMINFWIWLNLDGGRDADKRLVWIRWFSFRHVCSAFSMTYVRMCERMSVRICLCQKRKGFDNPKRYDNAHVRVAKFNCLSQYLSRLKEACACSNYSCAVLVFVQDAVRTWDFRIINVLVSHPFYATEAEIGILICVFI